MAKTKTQTGLDPRLHYVAVTAIIVNKEGKYLIAKRAGWEKFQPNKWTVPGGKLRSDEYAKMAITHHDGNQRYDVVKWVLDNEVKSEVNLEIHPPQYVCDLVAMRPDGHPLLVMSYWAKHKAGKVKLKDKSLTEYAWVTLAEAKKYDLIDGIQDEIKIVDKILKKGKK